MAVTAKTGPNQKVRIAHFERFNWLSAKNKKETVWGAAPHWSAEISWAIVAVLGEQSVLLDRSCGSTSWMEPTYVINKIY